MTFPPAILPLDASDRIVIKPSWAEYGNVHGKIEERLFGAAASGLRGIYLGLVASVAIVAFGFTIVVKQAAQPYTVTDPDDDV